eukprot:COSAG05_NODE_2259_length_3324_cov_9.708837_1_plen_73_part_00
MRYKPAVCQHGTIGDIGQGIHLDITSSLSWTDEVNFGLGWGLVGPTGGSDSGEGREPLLPSAVGPKGRKRLA